MALFIVTNFSEHQMNLKKDSKESSSYESIENNSKHLLSTIKKDIFGSQDDYITVDESRKETGDLINNGILEIVKDNLQMTEKTIYQARYSLAEKSVEAISSKLHPVPELKGYENETDSEDNDERKEEEKLITILRRTEIDDDIERKSISSFISFSNMDSQRNSKTNEYIRSNTSNLINQEDIKMLNHRISAQRQSYNGLNYNFNYINEIPNNQRHISSIPRQTLPLNMSQYNYSRSSLFNSQMKNSMNSHNRFESSNLSTEYSTNNNSINLAIGNVYYSSMSKPDNLNLSNQYRTDNNFFRSSNYFTPCSPCKLVYKNSLSDYISLDDLKKNSQNISSYINSQNGSRCLQRSLSLFTSEEISALLELVQPILHEIVNNNFGNYFCQKLFKMLDQKQRIDIWNILSTQTLLYATNDHGNHCFQSLIESVCSVQEESIAISKLMPYFKNLSCNQYGTHILQKIVLKFSEFGKLVLVQFIRDNFIMLACDAQGVCLIKKYIVSLNHSSDSLKHDLINQIKASIAKLISDSYGNYAILCMLEEWKLGPCEKIVKALEKNLAVYTSHKFSSTLVQKAFDLLSSVRNLI